MIAQAVQTVLSGNDAILAVASDRIWADIAPSQQNDPYITYSIVDDVDNVHLLGVSSLVQSRVQVSSYARRKIDARSLADKVRTALLSAKGAIAGVTVQAVRPDGSRSAYDDPTEASDTGLHGVLSDFVVSWHRAA